MQHVSANLAGGLEAADAVWTWSTSCLPKTVVMWHKILHPTDVTGSPMKLETDYLEEKKGNLDTSLHLSWWTVEEPQRIGLTKLWHTENRLLAVAQLFTVRYLLIMALRTYSVCILCLKVSVNSGVSQSSSSVCLMLSCVCVSAAFISYSDPHVAQRSLSVNPLRNGLETLHSGAHAAHLSVRRGFPEGALYESNNTLYYRCCVYLWYADVYPILWRREKI